MGGPAGKKSRLRARLLLLLGATILALGAAEIGVRIFWGRFRMPGDVVLEYPIARPGPFHGKAYGFRPDASFSARYDGDPFGTLDDDQMAYRTNECGFRDVAFEPLLVQKGPAVAILGDSFAYGEGVRAGERFSDVLRRELPGDARVFNLGIPGYTTVNEREVARVMLPIIRPKLTVVAYCLNDPIPFSDAADGDRFAFDFVNHRRGRLTDQDRYGASDSPFYLVRLAKRKLALRRLRNETIEWYRSMYDGPDPSWRKSRWALLDIQGDAREAGSKLAVMLIPLFIDLGDGYPFRKEHRVIADWCREQDIPVLDLLPSFRGMDTEKLIVHPMDRHPNAKAHRIIAEALLPFVRREW